MHAVCCLVILAGLPGCACPTLRCSRGDIESITRPRSTYHDVLRAHAGGGVMFSSDGQHTAHARKMQLLQRPGSLATHLTAQPGPAGRWRRRRAYGESCVVKNQGHGCGRRRRLQRPGPWLACSYAQRYACSLLHSGYLTCALCPSCHTTALGGQIQGLEHLSASRDLCLRPGPSHATEASAGLRASEGTS